MIQALLAGIIGKDAETREAGGTTVTKFSVACKTGKKDETQWVECSMWDERGAKLEQYLKKGERVSVIGRVSARAYESKGEQRASLEVRVDQVTLLGGSKRQEPEEPVGW